jgi:hypothetical protein
MEVLLFSPKKLQKNPQPGLRKTIEFPEIMNPELSWRRRVDSEFRVEGLCYVIYQFNIVDLNP